MMRTLPILVGLALAVTSPVIAQDYANYRVLDTKVIDGMIAGPAQSAALLSPDGSRLLHLSGRNPDMCLYAPTQVGSWAQLGCADYTEDNRPGEAQDMLWSPDSTMLLMPTIGMATLRFRDTDIRVFDPSTFSVRNLTDDGFDGSLADQKQSNLDLLAQWGDAETIYFARNALPDGGAKAGVTTSLMSVAATGGEPTKVIDIATNGALAVWNFAMAPEHGLFAYSIEGEPNADRAGIYLLKSGSTEPARVVEPSDVGGIRVVSLSFSVDGRYLLLFGRLEDNSGTARVLDLASGDLLSVVQNQNIMGAAWSPTGSALAYITYDRTKPDMPGGLFLAAAPDLPARLLVGGAFYPPVCCGDRPFIWASNDTIVLSPIGPGGVHYIQLGE